MEDLPVEHRFLDDIVTDVQITKISTVFLTMTMTINVGSSTVRITYGGCTPPGASLCENNGNVVFHLLYLTLSVI